MFIKRYHFVLAPFVSSKARAPLFVVRNFAKLAFCQISFAIEGSVMGTRRVRRMQRQVDMKISRRKNGILKKKERARRDVRMLEILKKGQLPYIPSVMSWLSMQLDKKSTRITQADVDTMLKT